jgi:hypothetical protein
MAPLLDLPTELLNEVLLKLEQKSLKELRRVCRESHAHVTPILFSRVYFDFDVNGTDALVNISRQPHLATYVKTIELQRRSGLKKFDDFWDWQHATIYDYEPLVPGDGHDEVEILENIMSRSDWEHMTDDSRRALFHDYQLDYDAINRRTSQLASAMSSAIQHSTVHQSAHRRGECQYSMIICPLLGPLSGYTRLEHQSVMRLRYLLEPCDDLLGLFLS